jgi:hypothetical protein
MCHLVTRVPRDFDCISFRRPLYPRMSDYSLFKGTLLLTYMGRKYGALTVGIRQTCFAVHALSNYFYCLCLIRCAEKTVKGRLETPTKQCIYETTKAYLF